MALVSLLALGEFMNDTEEEKPFIPSYAHTALHLHFSLGFLMTALVCQ